VVPAARAAAAVREPRPLRSALAPEAKSAGGTAG